MKLGPGVKMLKMCIFNLFKKWVQHCVKTLNALFTVKWDDAHAPILWNRLPHQTRSAESVEVFKNISKLSCSMID